MTDDIIAQLSKISAVKVISRICRCSTRTRIKITPNWRRTRRAHVLQGSVRRSDGRIRIVAQLMEVESDETLWAQTYDRDLTDVFAVQSEIAQRIARALHAELSRDETARVEKQGTANMEAYRVSAQGPTRAEPTHNSRLGTSPGELQKAIELDPNYALAHVGLAECYRRLGEEENELRMSREAIPRALEIDDTLAEAHTALGGVRLQDWDWAGAKKAHLRAIELSPNSPRAYGGYSGYLITAGPTAEAVEAAKKARELNPLSLDVNAHVGWALWFDRQEDEAIKQFQSITTLEPRFGEALARTRLGLPRQRNVSRRDRIVRKVP